MVKVRRSTLVAAAVVLLFFLALTAVAYINALRQAKAIQVFNAAVKYVLVPHGIAVSNFTVKSFSRIACMGTANGSVQFFLLSPDQYQNCGEEPHDILGNLRYAARGLHQCDQRIRQAWHVLRRDLQLLAEPDG